MRLRLLCICVGVVQVGQGVGQRGATYNRGGGQGGWDRRASQYYDDYYSDEYYYGKQNNSMNGVQIPIVVVVSPEYMKCCMPR